MKNWKYIKGAEVGNTIYSELNKNDKRVVIESDGSWYVYDKNGKIVEQGRESNSDNAFGKFKAKGYNSKACNQDGVARMFQGLVKDEDKDEKHYEGAIDDLEKVGNISKDELLKTLEAEKKLLKVLEERGGEKGYGTIPVLYRDAKKQIQDIEKKLKNIGNKVGNKYTVVYEKNLRAPLPGFGSYKVIDEKYPSKVIEVFKDEASAKKYADDLNKNPTSKWTDIYKHFEKASMAELGKIKSRQDALKFLQEKGESSANPAVQEAAKRFVGNSKVGNVQFAGDYYDIKQEPDGNFYIYVNGGAKTYGPYRSKGEAEGALKKKLAERNRTGNAIGGGVQSEAVLTEAKDGSQYWVEKTSKSGQYAQYNLYYTIGQGKRHAGVFKDKEAAVAAGKRIIGNSYSDKLPTAMDYRKALDEIIEKKSLNPDEARKKYGQFTYAQWEKELGHKIGNSEDEKFAYVMREFEEGKLKSSSGETVTDPAQAKAIAYSESKKAENGLARARKAIH